MEKKENMAQPSDLNKFSPIMPLREQNAQKVKEIVKEKLKNSKFNNPKNWPIYTKYLPKNNPRYTGL